MHTTLGNLLAVLHLGGALASLAHDVWCYAITYREEDDFRRRADAFFTTRPPGALGVLLHLAMMAVVGMGMLIHALLWPVLLLFFLFRPRQPHMDRNDETPPVP